MTLAKDGKADFIQDHPGQERGPGIEFGWHRGESLDSTLNAAWAEWEIITKERSRDQWMENY